VHFGRVRIATGVELHYAEQGDADGAPIVLLHGWPDSWFSYSQVLALLPRGYRALAPDQRGFGDSERPPSGYGIRDLAADVVAFLDAVGIERATVVGHSLGSFVARRVAIAHPERVTRLVLIGSALSPMNPVTREVQAAVAGLADPIPAAFARDFQAGTVHVPPPAAFFERIVAESLRLPARVWRAVLEGLLAYDDAQELARIAAPTLLMWGDRDALFARGDQDGLLRAIPGARLTIYTDTGHCPNWERPERVAIGLEAFVPRA
jgi:pimeloyl-ACP methyl ester carboxylesterase